MSSATQQAFADALIFNPATAIITAYRPLVTTAGVAPAIAPLRPPVPVGAVVALWFGTNGDTLTRTSAHKALQAVISIRLKVLFLRFYGHCH